MSVVARPTKVSVDVGNVNVPVLTIVEMTGAVKVSPAMVAAVPPRLTDVEPTVIELLVKAELATLLKVPPNVRFPLVVTVPVKVSPFTVPVPPTLVTVPTVGVCQVGAEFPLEVNTCPDVP